MATEQQGIMSLPQGGQEAAPQLSIEDSYDAISGALGDANPEAGGQLQQLMAQLTPMLDQLPDEQLDAMIQVFQYLHDHPEEYAAKVQEAVQQGIFEPGMLPEQYDPELIAALGMVFLEARRQRQAGNQREQAMQMPQPPATMARGGIAEAARMVASRGRHGDTMLAHINKDEAKLLRKRGGSGTINPATGLPEYWNPFKAVVDLGKSAVSAVRSVTSSIASAIKPVLNTTVGKVLATAALATFLGPGAFGIAGMGLSTAASMGLASGAITAIQGGSLKDILRSGATSYFTAAMAPTVGGAAGSALGVTSTAGQAALGAGITGAGIAKLSGQSLQDSIKSGLTQGVIAGAVNLANNPAPAPTGEGAPVVDGKPMTVEEIQQQIAEGGGMQSTNPTAPPPPAANAAPGMTPQGPQAPGAMGPQQGIASLGPEFNQYETPLSKVQNMASSTYEGAKDLYNKYVSPSGIQQQGMVDARAAGEAAYQDTLGRTGSQTLAEKAYQSAYDAAKPGVFAKYGPMVGVGLGAAALAGGFQPTPLPPSALAEKLAGNPGEDLIRANPSQYITQNLPGVQYDASGNIAGGSPWTPRGTMADVRQAMPGTSSTFMPSYYAAPQGAVSQQQGPIYQPYNTASMYTFMQPQSPYNFLPRYAADGGMMEMQSASGGPVDFNAPPSEGGMGSQGIAGVPVQHFWFGGLADRILGLVRNTVNKVTTTPAAPATAAPAAAPAASSAPALTAPAASSAPALTARTPPAAMQAPTLGNMPPSMPASSGISSLAARLYPSLYNSQFRQQMMSPFARQGLASFAEGGYPRRTGQISGPGTEKSDSIPAMLSDGEFVMTAKAVRGAGKGDRRAGAKKMYALMHQLERNASRG